MGRESRVTILVVDDEDYTCNLMRRLLEKKGYRVYTAGDGIEGLKLFQELSVDLVLLDQRMPGMDGLEVLRRCKEIDHDVSVIMMTAYGTVEKAVEAMKLGAFYYLTKPFNNLDEVELLVERALKDKFLRDENRYLKTQLDAEYSFDAVIGKSKVMLQVIEIVKKVAPLDSTVLLYGETGTGKELIANTIHRHSLRANKRFLAVNCGALSETLLESSLFGFEKGAFTGAVKTTPGYFEEADGGTLFLDEITATSLKLQTSLLRVIQEKEFTRLGSTAKIKTDFRLIVATNCDLEEEVAKGRFRKDLYYRINVIPIHLPPLRERRGDIPLLANSFLEKFKQKLGKDEVGPFSAEAMELFENYDFNGNVRELENIVECIVALKERGRIEVSDLPSRVIQSKIPIKDIKNYYDMPFQKAKEIFEKVYIEDILRKTGGNVTKASEITGIKRQNLYVKMKKFGLR